MGFAPRNPRRAASVDSADRHGDARLQRSEDCRGAPEAEAKLLSCEPPLQQLVVHAKGGAAARVGVPDELGEQADRCARSGGALSGTDESAERARLADMARLSVAYIAVRALRVHVWSSAFRRLRFARGIGPHKCGTPNGTRLGVPPLGGSS